MTYFHVNAMCLRVFGSNMVVDQKQAIELLKAGQVIGIPTDTVYGFAVLPEFSDKVYQLKNRALSKKLISFVGPSHKFMVDDYTQDIFNQYWPGNYTFIIKQDNELVSYRIPNESNVINLLETLGEPILTTSANVSGDDPITTKDEFLQRFSHIPLLDEVIICKKSKTPSKIYIIDNKEMKQIR